MTTRKPKKNYRKGAQTTPRIVMDYEASEITGILPPDKQRQFFEMCRKTLPEMISNPLR